MMEKLRHYLFRHKYELLLLALLQHLFIGIVLTDLPFYRSVVWPANMVVLGIASAGIFLGKGKARNMVKNVLAALVILLPLSIPILEWYSFFYDFLNLAYVLYFAFIFMEVIGFLLKPSYVDIDIISAAACGYFLLIEVSVFLLSYLYYNDPSSFPQINGAAMGTIYMDMVYFATILQTTVGFGDISPGTYQARLVVALLGIVGQFYTVVLLGILISKFTSASGERPGQ